MTITKETVLGAGGKPNFKSNLLSPKTINIEIKEKTKIIKPL